ncbi:MAG: hypothetical protein M3066_20605 [Actinomycetota bacterium]|nr:hypothetical protein [Actinomycetota bacterium]
MRKAARAVVALVGTSVTVMLLPGAATASVPLPVRGATLTATVDGAPVGASSEARPIRLSPLRQATLAVEVVNGSSKPLDVRIVRLEGKVVGLTFFAYDTAVGLKVAPGETGTRRFLLDLGGLDGQATGLIPGAVKLLDADRHVVAEEGGVIDVRGSLRSVYGVFGLGVAFLTVLSFLGALVGLARHRLPPNRWRRALRFLTPGLGLGLLLNFTLSATRVFVPTAGRWASIVVVSAAVLFGLGYLTPSPDTGDDEEEEGALVALPAPPVDPALPAAPAWPELATPDAMVALAADPAPVLPAPPKELPPAAAPSELATPEGLAAVPGDPAPPAGPEVGPPAGPAPVEDPRRPAPPTVVVPPVAAGEP